MKSPPGRSVVSTSAAGGGSDSRAARPERQESPIGRVPVPARRRRRRRRPVATTAAPVTAACLRNRRRPMEVLLMRESLHPAGGRWSVVGGRWPVAGGRWPVAGGRWPVAGQDSYEGVHRALRSSTRIHPPFRHFESNADSRRRRYEEARVRRVHDQPPARRSAGAGAIGQPVQPAAEPGRPQGGSRRCPGRGQRRFQSRHVGHDRESRRHRMRGRVHWRRSRIGMAGKPRHLGAEGKHGKLVQPAGTRALDGQPLGGRAAGRVAVRSTGEQSR